MYVLNMKISNFYSPKDIAKLRTEIEKHQKDNDSSATTETQESIKRIISAAAAKTASDGASSDELININSPAATTPTEDEKCTLDETKPVEVIMVAS